MSRPTLGAFASLRSVIENKGVTQPIFEYIVQQAAEGTPHKIIIAEVQDRWGEGITSDAITRMVRRSTEERQVAIRETIGKSLAPLVTSDLELLASIREEIADRAKAWFDRAGEETSAAAVWIKLKEAEMRCIEKRLHMAGAEGLNKDDDTEAATQRIMKKLSKAFGGPVITVEADCDVELEGCSPRQLMREAEPGQVDPVEVEE